MMEVAEERVIDILGGSALAQRARQVGLIEVLRRGLPVEAAARLVARCGLSDQQAARILGVSQRTLARHKANHKPLGLTLSDRAFRLARVVAHAEDVFDNNALALDWLKSPNRALGGAVPLELLDTDAGAQQVDEVLTRIDYGVYS